MLNPHAAFSGTSPSNCRELLGEKRSKAGSYVNSPSFLLFLVQFTLATLPKCTLNLMFPYYWCGSLSLSQTGEARMPEMTIRRPLLKIDLRHEQRL